MAENPLAKFSLEGRTAVLIGAGSGIGREAARVFAGAGARVVIADAEAERLAEAKEFIGGRPGQVETVTLDVRDREALERLAQDQGARGSLDIWANLAGVISAARVTDIEPAELDRIIDVTLKGTYWGCAAAARVMQAQGKGSIINISSGGADAPALEHSAYSLTKAAVNMLTRTLALELAPHGVRVNAIAPGFIDTPLIQYRYGTDMAAKEALLADRAAAIPLRRVGVPADIAYAMLYLASDASSFMTGQIIRPNGGWVMP